MKLTDYEVTEKGQDWLDEPGTLDLTTPKVKVLMAIYTGGGESDETWEGSRPVIVTPEV